MPLVGSIFESLAHVVVAELEVVVDIVVACAAFEFAFALASVSSIVAFQTTSDFEDLVGVVVFEGKTQFASDDEIVDALEESQLVVHQK